MNNFCAIFNRLLLILLLLALFFCQIVPFKKKSATIKLVLRKFYFVIVWQQTVRNNFKDHLNSVSLHRNLFIKSLTELKNKTKNQTLFFYTYFNN